MADKVKPRYRWSWTWQAWYLQDKLFTFEDLPRIVRPIAADPSKSILWYGLPVRNNDGW